jgi:uncharacterized protein
MALHGTALRSQDPRCDHCLPGLRCLRRYAGVRGATLGRRITGRRGVAMTTLPADDHLATKLMAAIRAGNTEALGRLLDEHPELASMTILNCKGKGRTPLHAATDWPGYFPNGPAVVRLLISRGADPNTPGTGGPYAETPLHWAASSDDADVAAALIDSGADIEARGGSIAGGTPLDNAVGYACWHVARLLVERGARVERLWHVAALGMMSRVEELLESEPQPTAADVNAAFWQACAGGQRRVAEYLLAKGADINWVPEYAKSTPLDAAGNLGTRRGTLTSWLRSLGAKSVESRALSFRPSAAAGASSGQCGAC